NTAAYAIIALIAVYVIFRLLQRYKFPLDKRFYYALLPFIAFGGLLRVAQDGGLLPRLIYIEGMELHPFVTPGIYVLTFVVVACCYAAVRLTGAKKEKVYSRTQLLGAALAALVFVWLMKELGPAVGSEGVSFLFYMILLALVPPLLFELIKRWYNKGAREELRRMEQFTVFSQALDGAATFVGVNFAGYGEQHLVANTIFEAFGTPFAFYILKMLFVLAVIFIVRREVKDKGEHVYLLLLITIFGLAPGIRDAFRIFFGV
ncbi:MAG: DUF63 family protein, partial [Candidatus Micrarchaeota archaeon]